MDSRLIRSGAVGAAGTTTYDLPISGGDAIQLAVYGNFDYGSGGTSVKCYLEGSYDGGATFTPVANMTFTTADDKKLFTVVPEGLASFDADASQADDTAINIIPPRLRMRTVVAGTYTSTTLDLWIYVS